MSHTLNQEADEMFQLTHTIHPSVSAQHLPQEFQPMTAEILRAGEESNVLEFLMERPIHTVAMVSMINDNGLENPLNRGTFYGVRDLNGNLEGVGLVGHATLLETVSDRALEALATVARSYPKTHMIMAEQERVAEFWESYAQTGQEPRLLCREWLMELQSVPASAKGISALRLATEAELDLVAPIQAQLAFEESGVNPMVSDPEGFRKRCLRRIHQGRTWVLIENGELIFKADVISETIDVIYIEGVWVKEDRRNTDYAARCMAELSRRLLAKTSSICLLSNELNTRALAFYKKCGFQFRATYDTIFLTLEESRSN